MKFVLNTNYSNTAASLVCIKGLYNLLVKNGHNAVVNDWNNYTEYDYVIFMAYDPDIDIAKQQNPNIKVGLADPKPTSINDVKKADFLLVSSIEQREFFLQYNSNIFIYYMIPEFDFYNINYKKKDKIVIGYHGNKVHLNTFYKHITPTLNKLGEVYDIELHAIYNIETLGKWKIGRPDENRCKVVDLQWYENCYKDYFKNIDIGIVPNLYPLEKEYFIKKYLTTSKYFFLETLSDHLTKYKFSTNAGRIFVFGMFGIPVVSEAVPSAGDVIKDGYSGRLVLYSHGWYNALEELITLVEVRNKYGNNLKKGIEKNFNRDLIFSNFMGFLANLSNKKNTMLVSEKPWFFKEMFFDLSNKVKKKLKI